ncbi:MAG: CBS domain-containing protein [Methanocellales archaeon]
MMKKVKKTGSPAPPKKGAEMFGRGTKDYGPVDFKSRIPERDGEVMKIANKEVITVPPTMTIMGVIKTMTQYGYRRIPVADAGTNRLVGIVTVLDILDFLGGGERHRIVQNRYSGNLLAAINEEVREIMEKNVITINRGGSLKEALELMMAHKKGGLPVVDEENRIVGIISERDILYIVLPSLGHKLVKDYMSKNIVTAPPALAIERAIKLMVGEGFRRLPIVSNGVLLGMVTASDILRYFASGEVFSKLVTGHIQEALEMPLKILMSADLTTITPDESLANAAEIMKKKNIGALPVIKDGVLLGIITERDYLRAMEEGHEGK